MTNKNLFQIFELEKASFSSRGQAVLISWVIIIGLVVVIAALVGKTIIDTTKEASEGLGDYLQDTQECKLAGISIKDSCQLPQVLNIEVENTETVEITGLLFRFFDVTGDAETKNINISIRPEETKDLEVPKSRMAVTTEIIPIIWTEEGKAICNEKTIKADHIQDCE